MANLFRWIWNIVSIGYGGGVVPGGPGPVLSPADDAAAPWVTRSAIAAVAAVVVLFVFSVPWPLVAGVAGLLLLPLLIHRIRALRGS